MEELFRIGSRLLISQLASKANTYAGSYDYQASVKSYNEDRFLVCSKITLIHMTMKIKPYKPTN